MQDHCKYLDAVHIARNTLLKLINTKYSKLAVKIGLFSLNIDIKNLNWC